jgi:hypothetical protein
MLRGDEFMASVTKDIILPRRREESGIKRDILKASLQKCDFRENNFDVNQD